MTVPTLTSAQTYNWGCPFVIESGNTEVHECHCRHPLTGENTRFVSGKHEIDMLFDVKEDIKILKDEKKGNGWLTKVKNISFIAVTLKILLICRY
jgi:hypothetical protein